MNKASEAKTKKLAKDILAKISPLVHDCESGLTAEEADYVRFSVAVWAAAMACVANREFLSFHSKHADMKELIGVDV